MPSEDQTVTFIASRVLILSGTIALLVGTIIAGKGFVSLVGAVLDARGISLAIAVALIVYLAVLIFLSVLVLLGVGALVQPRKLTITSDGITEVHNGQVRSERWENLSNPVKKFVSVGNASVVKIELERASGEPFAFRSDIYPETFDQIMAVIKDAMAGRAISRPVQDTQTRNYLLFALVALLSILALVHVWVR